MDYSHPPQVKHSPKFQLCHNCVTILEIKYPTTPWFMTDHPPCWGTLPQRGAWVAFGFPRSSKYVTSTYIYVLYMIYMLWFVDYQDLPGYVLYTSIYNDLSDVYLLKYHSLSRLYWSIVESRVTYMLPTCSGSAPMLYMQNQHHFATCLLPDSSSVMR